MRDLHVLDHCRCFDRRVADAYGNFGDGTCGVFEPKVGGVMLQVIASSGEGWEHVSVSLPNRTPSWEQMDAIKRLFFRDEETVMQLHVPPSDHVNIHPNCLHLWRSTTQEIPRPPKWMIA